MTHDENLQNLLQRIMEEHPDASHDTWEAIYLATAMARIHLIVEGPNRAFAADLPCDRITAFSDTDSGPVERPKCHALQTDLIARYLPHTARRNK